MKAKNWPDDLVELTESMAKSFIESSPPAEKVMGVVNNLPVWVDQQITEDRLATVEVQWVESEIERIRDELEKVQDSDPNSVGSVSDWRSYRKSLRAWDQHKNFPDKNFRPKAPDIKE